MVEDLIDVEKGADLSLRLHDPFLFGAVENRTLDLNQSTLRQARAEGQEHGLPQHPHLRSVRLFKLRDRLTLELVRR